MWSLSLLTALVIIYPISANGIELPKNQPVQIETEAVFDPGLSDPFFEVSEWSYPWWIIKNSDGTIENTAGGSNDEKELPVLYHTAKCLTAHQFEHQINFCDAKLLSDGALELFIHDESASTSDNLRILVKDGRFNSQYWTFYPADKGDEGLMWKTTRQELILNKLIYERGRELKGMVNFECLQESTNPKYGGRSPERITIQGVFRTRIE